MNDYESLALAASVTMALILVSGKLGSFQLSHGQKLKMALIWVGLFVFVAAAYVFWQSWN